MHPYNCYRDWSVNCIFVKIIYREFPFICLIPIFADFLGTNVPPNHEIQSKPQNNHIKENEHPTFRESSNIDTTDHK